MSPVFHWFLPTAGDGRDIVARGQGVPLVGAGLTGRVTSWRAPDLAYLTQVARAAEQAGFTGVLTPTGTWCEDAWLVTAALISQTERLRFLVAFRPGITSPTLAAQMATTFQRLSGGRLLLNVVTGGDSAEQARFGDHLPHDERYARTGEFLDVVRGAWSGRPYDFSGQYYQVSGATVADPPDPLPQVYFGGSSAAAGPVAARGADVYLTWGEPPAQVAEKITWMRGLAAAAGRTLRFGIRLHVITRDTAADAWAEASRLLDSLDPADIETAQRPCPGRSRSGRAACGPCTPATGRAARPPSLRSPPTCGPESAWSGAAPAPPWWAATRRWPTGSRSTWRWASRSSSSPATRTWRRRTGSARGCCPNCGAGRRRPRRRCWQRRPGSSGRLAQGRPGEGRAAQGRPDGSAVAIAAGSYSTVTGR